MKSFDTQKIRSALPCRADNKEKLSVFSIAQDDVKLPPLGIDSFAGQVKVFRFYLRAELILLERGMIGP